MSRERDAKGECLICGAPIEYLKEDILMECVICRKKEMSKTRCTNGHYICSDCHTSGMDSIVKSCLAESSRDPVHIIEKMMSMDFCHFPTKTPEGISILRRAFRKCTAAENKCPAVPADFGAPAGPG